jgi:uncharacterized protein YbjT (DUF2867 family)
MARIAILGATGFVGTALSLKLLDQGHQVVALSRKPEKWPLQHNNLSTVKGEITDERAVTQVLNEVDSAFYLVHGLAEDQDDFEYIEAKGAMVFVKAAQKTKLKKVIYLGGLGPEGDLSAHLRSRHLVGEILGLIPGACLEFRASIVLGAHSTSFEMIKALAQRLPVRPYAPWLESPCQPIALTDLLQYLIAGLEAQVLGHTVIEIGAPDVLPYGDLLDLAIKIEELSRPKFLLPPMDQRLLLPMIDLVLPEFSHIGKKLFLSLSHSTVVTDRKALELFPDIKPLSVEEAMKVAFAESSTSYPAVWEGDFWKEVKDHTLLQTRQGQETLIKKLKLLSSAYPDKFLGRKLWRKKK